MSSDNEYYILLHVGGHFVKDPYVRYVGGKVIRLKEDSDTISYFELCKIVKIGLGFSTPGTVGLQNNLRVIYNDTSTIAMLEFLVDNPIIVDEIFLLTTGECDVEGLEVHGEGDGEGVESDGESDLEKVESGEVQVDGDRVSATGIEVDEDIGIESGGHISLGSTVGEDSDSEVAANEYAGDFATSDGVDNVDDECVGDFAISDGMDSVVDEYDSDEHGSLVESDEDEEHEDGERRRSKFPLYNDKLKFSLGMLFNDGKQFKSAIRKYSKECRRQLKFIKNEPKRFVMRCIHHCSVSFKIKIVTIDMIAQHFEVNIKDHPKLKLREIQRRCAFEMHKIVNEKMAGNHKEGFGLLWDYAHELRSKMPGSTIKMIVQRVTGYYVCFDALKRD
ncbi:hypothetical protein GOBAR_AA39768 [Gossypium barbadense]|uniref:Uncharacterized protein n=1 Tax=Gossypium barbadense TaxID=3634 RepID=A0A2P5VQ26_GOSBA|nr:hypothetical protein GOBAR_AA39768 [Gossypium barbadense]